MKVSILSRDDAEQLVEGGFPRNTAVISFYDPYNKRSIFDSSPVDYKGKCERLFLVKIKDLDIEALSDFGLTVDTYLTEAEELASFIKRAYADGLDFICQCEYGQSRSAACAAAIKEYFEKDGISIFADYRYYPNQLVFNKILDALIK